MEEFNINIDKLNEAIILAGSRTQLASDLGTAPSYITYMINNGTVELDKAQIIKDRYGVDITQGYKLNLKQYAPKKSVPTYEKDAFGRFDGITGELLEIYDSNNPCDFGCVFRVLSGEWSQLNDYVFKYLRDCSDDEIRIDNSIDKSLPLIAFDKKKIIHFKDYESFFIFLRRESYGRVGDTERTARSILRGLCTHDALANYHKWVWFGYENDKPTFPRESKHYDYDCGRYFLRDKDPDPKEVCRSINLYDNQEQTDNIQLQILNRLDELIRITKEQNTHLYAIRNKLDGESKVLAEISKSTKDIDDIFPSTFNGFKNVCRLLGEINYTQKRGKKHELSDIQADRWTQDILDS